MLLLDQELHRSSYSPVGDSLSDIEGAKAAGARVIGYANKPAKKAAFQAAGADALVTSMRQIAVALMQVEGL
ncbi:HAD hydrolase-like protein [Micromonospora globbae]|uniref:HAD hydrolase-like protein n=1 Tax=Micromonospora globbae TaxID=1894969 RepID=UPI00386C22F9|nr:HAD family hydrolase [Micromonospora globbae]